MIVQSTPFMVYQDNCNVTRCVTVLYAAESIWVIS
jgi:hypothetical protein